MSVQQQMEIEDLKKRVANIESPQWRAQFIADCYLVISENMAKEKDHKRPVLSLNGKRG